MGRLAWSLVAIPRMISTNFMRGTGFMKCMPTTACGRLVAAPMRVMLIELVLVARIASGCTIWGAGDASQTYSSGLRELRSRKGISSLGLRELRSRRHISDLRLTLHTTQPNATQCSAFKVGEIEV